MTLSNSEKWDAVVQCDPSYDGQFYYGVKTTGIFCRPSCKSKTPRQENVEFFEASTEAYAAGMRPCKRCRPDLLEYAPTRELLRQIKAIYDKDFSDREKLASQLRQIPVSPHHLTRLFQQEYGLTPIEYQNELRLTNALECLAIPGMSILNVALVSGFGSLSSFYACFKKKCDITPSEYRIKKARAKSTPSEGANANV